MKTSMRTLKLIGSTVTALAVVFGLSAGNALAQGHDHDAGGDSHDKKGKTESMGHAHDRASLHQGSVTMTDKHHFEVVFHNEELRIYVYTMAQDPIPNLKGVSGSAFLKSKKGDTLSLKLSYVAPDSSMKSTQGYLTAKHDFSGVKKGTMKCSFNIDGLANPKETSVNFRESVMVHDEKSKHEKMKMKMEHGDDKNKKDSDHDHGGH
jgi:hypothetical protein